MPARLRGLLLTRNEVRTRSDRKVEASLLPREPHAPTCIAGIPAAGTYVFVLAFFGRPGGQSCSNFTIVPTRGA